MQTKPPFPPRHWLTFPSDSLWHDPHYRRLWLSILLSSLSSQITAIALALVAAVVLQATPAQVGLLTAAGTLPYVLFSLPSGVWLDRVRKLPVYVGGELVMALVVLCVPLAWGLVQLSMGLMYAVEFVLGCVGGWVARRRKLCSRKWYRWQSWCRAMAKTRWRVLYRSSVAPALRVCSLSCWVRL